MISIPSVFGAIKKDGIYTLNDGFSSMQYQIMLHFLPVKGSAVKSDVILGKICVKTNLGNLVRNVNSQIVSTEESNITSFFKVSLICWALSQNTSPM